MSIIKREACSKRTSLSLDDVYPKNSLDGNWS